MADDEDHNESAAGETTAPTDEDGERERLAEQRRNFSSKHSAGDSYGTTTGASDASLRRRGMHRGRSSVILRRTGSTATTDQPFDRQQSAPVSLRSSASIRTRIASISRSEYHEDLKPILAAGLNINLIFVTFIIVLGSSFQFGYNIGVLNQPTKLIKDFYNTTYGSRFGNFSESSVTLTWSLTTALFIPGGMIGAFLGGWLADKIGRKKTILFSHIFAFLGAASSSVCVVAGSPELLMLGRILVGVNSGLGNCIAPMFLSEIAPFNYRGAFGTLHQLFVTLGILLASIFGIPQILGTEDLWPLLILVEVGPALVSLVILPLLPETPRYLLLVRQNREAARKALQFYRRTDDVSNDMEEMDTEFQQKTSVRKKSKPDVEKLAAAADNDAVEESKTADDSATFGLSQLLFTAELRRPLFVACMLQVIQQFSGINAVFFYSQGIFEDANVPAEHIPYAVIGTNAVNVLMTVIAVPMMDIAGRRPLLLFPMLAMVLDLALMTVCLILQANKFTWPGIAYISIGCIIIYVIAFAVGLGPIPMMIGAELFRQGPRPLAMAVAGVVNWLGTFAIAMGFESVQLQAGEYTFAIFIVLLIGFVLFVYFFVPETKNKTFEEIAAKFSPGGHLEVEELDEDDDGDVFDNVEATANEDGEHEDHHLVTLNFAGSEAPSSAAAASETKA